MPAERTELPEEIVDRIVRDAFRDGASDVYWLPHSRGVSVRLRRHGIQTEIASLPKDAGERCVARIKVLAGLLTYRTRVSQDGAMRDGGGVEGTEIRVSVMPTRHGERVSMRILRSSAEQPRYLDELGFADETIRALRSMLDREYGMVILTGPTGSGKTTTIYALIRELLRKRQDPAAIVTIEDPIECEIEGISQTAVSDGAEWGYAEALRAALRQDVKTLVVGEMRDRDVVNVTLDAALTGHRVLTTYHAGDIPSVYARLLHQGFEPFLIASAVTGVVSQRLAPRPDGGGMAPVAACLEPDDEWRAFIAENPGLGELRRRVAALPSADIEAQVRAAYRRGIIADSRSAD